jgi:anti-sigma factor RsiW
MPERLDPSSRDALLRRDLDDLLTDAERREFEAALKADPTLARERDGWARVRAAWAADAVATPREGLADAIVAEVLQGERRRSGVLRFDDAFRKPLAAAAAILLVAFGFWIGRAAPRTPNDVVAAPKDAEADEARFRDFYRNELRLSEADVEAQLEIGSRFERRREELRLGLKPQIDALDRAERDEKWRRLPPEARERWRKIDPRVMPEDPDPTGK